MRNERLKQIVDEKGIASAAEFARLTGLKESTARAYLIGSRSPPLEVCQRIGQALSVSGEWIYYGRGPKEGGRVSMSFMATPSDLRTTFRASLATRQGAPPRWRGGNVDARVVCAVDRVRARS
jgi:transcriptional regulator with XRE-family HTH domain